MCHGFFFFQAEDGIRDLTVTGVQTCALPILPASSGHSAFCWENSMVTARPVLDRTPSVPIVNPLSEFGRFVSDRTEWIADRWNKATGGQPELEIGRASCRERVENRREGGGDI